MKITVSPQVRVSSRRNVFKVSMKCYAGDADYDGSATFFVQPENISQVVAEILMVQNQFTHGRGGCRRMYDQANYFCIPCDEYDEETADNFWEWLDPELMAYPRDHEGGEQNYTLESFDILWLDENGNEHDVTIADTDSFVKEILTFNKMNHIGDYRVWEDGSAGLDDRFKAYRHDAILMVKNFVEKTTVTFGSCQSIM